MKRGPSVSSSYVSSINQIVGNVPLFKPNDKGDLYIRILPAFENGEEQPWVDFALGADDNYSGLGDQHFEISAVSIFRDGRMHWLSAASREQDAQENETEDSPAMLASKALWKQVQKAKTLVQAGYQNINEYFLPNKFGGSWMGVNQLQLVQALCFRASGKPLKSVDGQPYRYAVVDITKTGLQNLAKKLFETPEADATGENKATNIEESGFKDYCSCAGGRFVVIRKSANAKQPGYEVLIAKPPQGWENGLDPEYVKSIVRPWTGEANAIYHVPTHQEVFEALSSILPADLLGFLLKGTRFESMLSKAHLDLAENVRMVKAEDEDNANQEQLVDTGAVDVDAAPPRPAPRQPQVRVPAAGAPTTLRRGPTPPTPPSASRKSASAYVKPVIQAANAEMGELPHMGTPGEKAAKPAAAEDEFFDPLQAAEEEDVVDLG